MSWFFSVAGRRWATVAGASCSAGSFFIYYLPNAVFLDSFKETTHLYKSGNPAPLSPSVQILSNEVKKDLNLSIKQSENITFYPSVGFDFYRMGCIHDSGTPLNVFSKAVVGIPSNLGWKGDEDLSAKKIVLAHNPVKWSEPSGEKLKEGLIMSENAKKFAIAHHVYQTTLPDPLIKGTLAVFFTTTTFIFSRGLNHYLDFWKQPRLRRFIAYGLVGLFNFIMFSFMSDVINCRSEIKTDEALAELGLDYIQGGKEFIARTIVKNMAFRDILGKKGESYYTVSGNEKVLIRQKHAPLSARLDSMKRLEKNYTEGKKEEECVHCK